MSSPMTVKQLIEHLQQLVAVDVSVENLPVLVFNSYQQEAYKISKFTREDFIDPAPSTTVNEVLLITLDDN